MSQTLHWIYDTAANLAAENKILPANWRALETDTGVVKQGDGLTAYSSLSRATDLGKMVVKTVRFVQNATNTLHVGTVPIPAGAILHNIQVMSDALWNPTGAATMKVGDTADDDGYFTGIDLKATDLLVGEVLDTTPSTSWGGKEGAYLVAASGRRGPTSSNFAKYYAAGSNIIGTITVGTPANAQGRTNMVVVYSLGEAIDPVSSTP